MKPLNSLWNPVVILGFGLTRNLNELFMLSPDKLSKSSSSLLPSQKSTQNQISHWNKKSVTAFVSMCGCERERERERERETYCWWGCVWFRSSRPLNSYSNTRFRNATNRERKNNKPFHSISHFFINNQGGIIRRNKNIGRWGNAKVGRTLGLL